MITDGVVVGRVPGIHNGGVHQPDVSVRLLSQGDDVLLGRPDLHVHHLREVRTGNIGVPGGGNIDIRVKIFEQSTNQKYSSTLSLSTSQSG